MPTLAPPIQRALRLLVAIALIASAARLPAGAVTLKGRILFEKVPATLNGLDFKHVSDKPVPLAAVELRDESASRVLVRGTTTDGGEFSLDAPSHTGKVNLVVWAETTQLLVRDPANGQTHGAMWGPLDPARRHELFLTDNGRYSGAFNILAAIRQANRVIERLDPTITLARPRLTVYWSPRSTEGAFYRSERNAIYLRGVRTEDSDEFDDSVILHEYGHHIMKRFSRDDGIGGQHNLGERLDPRVAWSEGAATYFGQAILGHSQYIDTLSPGKGWGMDIDENIAEWDTTPGYWSEGTVASALWDMQADTGWEGDYLGLGFAPVWRVLRDHLPQQSFVYLLTAADGLIGRNSVLNAGVTGILGQRQIEYRHGVVPPTPLPFPRLLTRGVTVRGSVDQHQSKRANLFDSAHFYQFKLASPASVRIRLKVAGAVSGIADSSIADLVLELYDTRGQWLVAAGDAAGINSTKEITRTLPAGTYTVGVVGLRWTGSEYLPAGANYELTAEF